MGSFNFLTVFSSFKEREKNIPKHKHLHLNLVIVFFFLQNLWIYLKKCCFSFKDTNYIFLIFLSLKRKKRPFFLIFDLILYHFRMHKSTGILNWISNCSNSFFWILFDFLNFCNFRHEKNEEEFMQIEIKFRN